MSTAGQGGYYPHIDGIRAIAILSVLFYHVFPRLCPGGFIGVDVFFVLSGFLITQGLHQDLQAGQFSISRFYARRIRRIFPAYATLIFLVLLAGCVLYYGWDLCILARTACSSAFFYSNIYFWLNSGYFDPASHSNPLLNMWSLSVEEQFYIFFPLALACCYRWARRWLATALGLGFLVSLAWSCYRVQGGHGSMTGSFYLLPFRAWELLAGSLLAIYPRRLQGRLPWIGMLAILLLGSQFFLYRSKMPFPGLAALGPVLCAFLLLQYGHRGWSRVILENKGMVFLGKISYSLYLYHWPVLVFARYVAGTTANPWLLGGIVILVSLALAILSWRWVETPIRLTRWKPRRYFLLAGAGTAAILLLLGAARFLGDYEHKHSLVEKKQDYWQGSAATSYPQPNWEEVTSGSPILVRLGNDEAPCYMLWGDSHALALSPGFDAFSLESGINGLYVGLRHVLMDSATWRDMPENDRHLEEVLAWLQSHQEVRTVILSNRWAVRAQGTTNEDGGTRTYHAPYIDEDTTPAAAFETGLTRLCEKLQTMGKQIIIVSSIPEQRETVEVKIHKARLVGIDWTRLVVGLDEYKERQKEAFAVLRKLERRGMVRVLWVEDFFFPQGKTRPILEDGYSMYIDDDHLSPSGARLLLRHLAPQLKELLKERARD